ncbi:MAG: DUF799 family lipoprotein [Candidatus Schekmanbacteria bacterium]|nr:DUF799 family lipoprotein [Candidatus Schekmanbacteria bacterium]
MTKEKLGFVILFLILIIFPAVGCAPKLHTIVPDYEQRRPQTIALLLVLNETNDYDAPKAFEEIVYAHMQNRGYRIISPGEVRNLLAARNIHEAGEMFTLTSKELGELLNADALLYCTVLDWSSVYLVVYSSVSVEARFELVEAKTGTKLWETTRKSSLKRAGWDKESLERNIINAAFSSYEPRAHDVVRMALGTLPYGPHYSGYQMRGCLAP